MSGQHFFLNLQKPISKKLPIENLPRLFAVLEVLFEDDENVESFSVTGPNGEDVTPFSIHEPELYVGRTIHVTTASPPPIPCSVSGREMSINPNAQFAIEMKFIEDSLLLLKLLCDWKVGKETFQHTSFGLQKFYTDVVDDEVLWTRYTSCSGDIGDLVSILYEMTLVLPRSKMRYGQNLRARLVLFTSDKCHPVLQAVKRTNNISVLVVKSNPDKGDIVML